MRIAFAGTPEFALPPLEALASSRHALIGVLTQPDRPAGRGRELTASPVKRRALELGLPLAQPRTLRTSEGREPLAAWAPDVLVVVAYGLILPPEALALPRRGCLNIHGSVLPRWRGAAPIQRAILAGDAQTGVTIMQMDAGLDTGPILGVERVAIGEHMSSGELHDLLAPLGARALLAVLDELEAGTARATPQPQAGATYAPKIDKSEARIDWRRPAIEIDRMIRAFRPWPVAETRLAGEPLRVHRARVGEAAAAGADEPGRVLGLQGEGLRVCCGDGSVLELLEVQRPGRRVLGAAEFARGSRVIGERLA